MRSILAILAVIFCLSGTVAHGDQKDANLDPLFERLRAAESPNDARVLEALIWSLWLQSGSDTVDLLMKRSMEAMNAGQFGASLAILDTVVELAPDFAEGWNKRATVYYLMGRFDDSLKDVDRTLDLEPRHFGALAGLGMINIQLGKENEALEAYERTLDVHPHLGDVKVEVERLTKKLHGEKI